MVESTFNKDQWLINPETKKFFDSIRDTRQKRLSAAEKTAGLEDPNLQDLRSILIQAGTLAELIDSYEQELKALVKQ